MLKCKSKPHVRCQTHTIKIGYDENKNQIRGFSVLGLGNTHNMQAGWKVTSDLTAHFWENSCSKE